MTDKPEVYIVHHHDIEKHAEHFNEGYDEAHRQGVGGEASRNWLTEKLHPLLKDRVDPADIYHLLDQIADALLSEADLEPTLTASEVKVLTETASKLAYALGRKDAGEEIAARIRTEINDFPSYAWNAADVHNGLKLALVIANDTASQAPQDASDATSGVPGHQEVGSETQVVSNRVPAFCGRCEATSNWESVERAQAWFDDHMASHATQDAERGTP